MRGCGLEYTIIKRIVNFKDWVGGGGGGGIY